MEFREGLEIVYTWPNLIAILQSIDNLLAISYNFFATSNASFSPYPPSTASL
jgi:hypothetical protein